MSTTVALGVVAAVVAPLVTTLGFIVWDNHWTGSAFALNMFKCNLAALWFLMVSLATRVPVPFPSNIFTVDAIGFLMLSSTIGIVLGDVLWLEALRLLGVRRVIVVDTLKPFVAALLGWTILGEQLPLPALAGMVLTVSGVYLVSREQPTSQNETTTTTTTTTEELAGVIPVSDQQLEHHPAATNAAVSSDDNLQNTIITTVTGTQSVPDVDVESVHGSTDDQHDSVLEAAAAAAVSVQTEGTSDEIVSDVVHDNAATTSNSEQDMKADSSVVHTSRPSSSSIHGSLRETRTNSITSLRKGYIMAAINVILDTYGSVLTKQYGTNMSTWEISLIRFGFAGIVLLLVSIIMTIRAALCGVVVVVVVTTTNSNGTSGQPATNNPTPCWYALPMDMSHMAWFKIVVGVALVTFLAPALTNYALFQIALALALTLGSLGPIYSLPLSWLLQQDKPTICASIGAALAVAGVIVLSFVGTL